MAITQESDQLQVIDWLIDVAYAYLLLIANESYILIKIKAFLTIYN